MKFDSFKPFGGAELTLRQRGMVLLADLLQNKEV